MTTPEDFFKKQAELDEMVLAQAIAIDAAMSMVIMMLVTTYGKEIAVSLLEVSINRIAGRGTKHYDKMLDSWKDGIEKLNDKMIQDLRSARQ